MAISNVDIWQSAIDGIVEFIELVSQPMSLQNRDIQTPQTNVFDITQEFNEFDQFSGAIDTSGQGKTLFDNSNIERVLTHIIYREFATGADDSEKWILYDNRRFDILAVENVGELNGILVYACNERGPTSSVVNDI